MSLADHGLWPSTPEAAREVQSRLRERVRAEDAFGAVGIVAGLDVHHGAESGLTYAAAVALRLPDLEIVGSALAARPTAFPYVPGLLSFREAPAMLEALARLEPRPDLVLIDGQGLAHPRRFGLACHVGVLADLPTVGVAKSRLTGRFDPPGTERGAWSPLVAGRGGREVIGAAVVTRAGKSPVFVSVGQRVGLESAVAWTLKLATRYRLPEPARAADRLSRAHPP